ncbi:transposase [Nitrosomonas communis]|uniref:transposase n=1 Tax=Nitrosomonas communis TaxID=44574 RepID=UPI0021641A0B|nr:transposase [Nitrosomonas sp. PLL12]
MFHHRCIQSHNAIVEFVDQRKVSVGWVHEFKLHLALNEQEALRGMNIMASKADGCDAELKLSRALFGKFFNDRELPPPSAL